MHTDYYKTKASVAEYIELAKDVSGKDLIEKLKPFLPDTASLLEIGSGPGTDWNLLNTTYNVVGSDNSEVFLKHLTTHNPTGEFLLLDAITLDTDKKFDGLYANKVLHHLTNDELLASIKQQVGLLNTNGVICFSFWKGEGSEMFKGMFVNYHTKNSLSSFFEANFEILLLESYQEFEADDSLLLIAKKK
ncbi:class I SAM-dependent methyltransferase [Tenacibaculum sp. 190524A02b]|uniref:class I SAM-dependent methyltransferase n=1 Tax=Tenacibaculum vairaonense TaxID=3137860 RepID=UPI0031FB1535